MHNIFSKVSVFAFMLSAFVFLGGQSAGQNKPARTDIRQLEHPGTDNTKPETAASQNAVEAAPAPAANRTKKVMITDFDARGISKWWLGNWDIGSLFANSMIGPLTRTDGYEVVERERMLELFKEQGLSESERFNQSSVTKIGRLLGADYILFGYLSDFTRKVSNKIIYTETSARMSFTVRMVDVATGKVVNLVEENYVSKPKQNFSQSTSTSTKLSLTDPETLQSLFGPAITEAVKEAVGKLTGGMAGQASNSAVSSGQVNTTGANPAMVQAGAGLRGKVADVTGNTITINRGRQHGVREGQFFAVVKIIKEIKDPDTGNVIKTQTEEIARLRINTVNDASSEGVLVSGDIASFAFGTEVVLVESKKP